ncbi:MAG: hypothetical protein NTW25_08230 [Candidatus Kapabacteria bacterium]|nr:hypothetical protein [Candidatus Kapabacteria bacterium]
MKKAEINIDIKDDDLLPEYKIDYSKVKRNPYFRKNRTFVEIDEDIAKVFQSSENINTVLKAIAKSIPQNSVASL